MRPVKLQTCHSTDNFYRRERLVNVSEKRQRTPITHGNEQRIRIIDPELESVGNGSLKLNKSSQKKSFSEKQGSSK